MTDKRGPIDKSVPAPALSFDEGHTVVDEQLDDAFSVDPFFADDDDPVQDPDLEPRRSSAAFVLPPLNFDDIVINADPQDGRRLEEATMLVSRELLFGDEDVHARETSPGALSNSGELPPVPVDQPRYRPPAGMTIEAPSMVRRGTGPLGMAAVTPEALATAIVENEGTAEIEAVDIDEIEDWEEGADESWAPIEEAVKASWDREPTNQRVASSPPAGGGARSSSAIDEPITAPRASSPVIEVLRASSSSIEAPRASSPAIAAPRASSPVVVAPRGASPAVAAPRASSPAVAAPRGASPAKTLPLATSGPSAPASWSPAPVVVGAAVREVSRSIEIPESSPKFTDVDSALASLEQDYEIDEVPIQDPYEITGLIVIQEPTWAGPRPSSPEVEPTRQIEYRMSTLSGEGDLPMPWPRFVGEMRGELVAQREARVRASYVHEVADVLRMAGDRWAGQAAAMDALALDLNPTWLPSLRARLVDALMMGERGHGQEEALTAYRAALDETMAALQGEEEGGQSEALGLLGALRCEDALSAELAGDLGRAKRAFGEASVVEGGAFFSLNDARYALVEGRLIDAASAMMAVAGHAPEGAAGDAQRAMWLVEAAEVLRRQGRSEKAVRLYRKALDCDPTSTAAYRSLQLVAWREGDLELELEGLTGQLAILVESGRKLGRNDLRLRLMKRRAAARFFRLGQIMSRTGRHDEAVKALKDALGIRRHELLYLRALERAANSAEDWEQVARALTRQIGLIVDPVLQALLLVEQAHVYGLAGDHQAARDHLKRSLEVAPDCLPARISLGRMLLAEGRWDELLALRRGGSEEAPDPNLDQAPRRARDAWRRGEIHEYCTGDMPTAADEYLKAFRWAPSEGPWIKAVERLLIQTGRWTELAEVYGTLSVKAASPRRRGDAQLKAARLSELRGDYEGAIGAMSALIEGEGAALGVMEELAHMYRRGGWEKAAAEVLEQVVEVGAELGAALPPDSAEAEDARWVRARSLRWLAHLYEHALDDSKAALEAHGRVLSLTPGEPSALERLRQALVRRGDWGQLVGLLEAQAEATDREEVRRDLVLEAADLCLKRLRDRDRALRLLRALRERSPGDPSVLDALEEALRQRRDWGALADLLLERALRHGVDDPHQGARQAVEAALLRRERLDDRAGALAAFKVALEISPGLSLAHRGVARLMEESGDRAGLVLHLSRWQHRASTDGAWVSLGLEQAFVLEFELDQPEAALEVHARVLDRSPGQIESLMASARLSARLDDVEGQARALRRLSAQVGDREDKIGLLVRAGRLSERLGQAEAEEDYRRALELDLGCEAARRGLERMLRKNGEHGELLALYLERAKATTGSHRVHYLMRIAGVYEAMGRLSDASEILRKVLALEPHFDLARLTLVRLARAQEDWETAAQMEEQLVRAAPSQEIRLAHLSEAASIYQHKLKNQARAEPLLKQIIDIDPGARGAYESLRSMYGDPSDEGQLDALLDVIEARLPVERGGRLVSMLREGIELASRRRPARALRYTEALLEYDPADISALMSGAALAEAGGDLDGAVRMLRRWLEAEEAEGRLVGPSPERRGLRLGVLLRLSTVLVDRLRDVRAAEPFLDELLAADPRNPKGCGLMARAQILLGHPERACELFKDLFELEPSATLALQIAWLLDENMKRLQEALAWYMRAQDIDPLNADAMKGFFGVMGRLGERSPGALHARMLNDRLDWLAEGFQQAIQEEPWQLDHMRQLARIHRLRGDEAGLRTIAGVLSYFDMADDEGLRASVARRPAGVPAKLLDGRGGVLTEEDIRQHVLLPEAGGLGRRVFGLVWESLASVDPDDLKRRGLSRADRLGEKGGDRRQGQIAQMARAIQVHGVDVYPHPNDPFAVLALFTPEPTLVVGSAIFEKPDDPFHHFRVARALESLRDGKGLMARRDAAQMLGALDEVLEQLYGGVASLPLFGVPPSGEDWLSGGSKRLNREVKRRVNRDLRSALDSGSGAGSVSWSAWIEACRLSPLRLGMAVCGEFGAAADAVAGTSFSLDPAGGSQRQVVILERMRDPRHAHDIETLLRFVGSSGFAALRARLGIAE